MSKPINLMTRKELIKLCKEEKIKGYSKYKKADLIKRINNHFNNKNYKSYHEDKNIFCHPDIINEIFSYIKPDIIEYRREIYEQIKLEHSQIIFEVNNIFDNKFKKIIKGIDYSRNCSNEYFNQWISILKRNFEKNNYSNFIYYIRSLRQTYQNLYDEEFMNNFELLVYKKFENNYIVKKTSKKLTKKQLLMLKKIYKINEIKTTMKVREMRKIVDDVYKEMF